TTAAPRVGAAEDPEAGPARRSLLELAGIQVEDKPKAAPAPRTTHDTAQLERPPLSESAFEDPLPEHVKNAPDPIIATNDDDFFKLIEESVLDAKKEPRPGRDR
ncbi:MAG: hypothetical protein JO284_06005, partial [Planctomycetaceae bacterium]|nr:hypothetical protein [Planctomycetaceae bacterium]